MIKHKTFPKSCNMCKHETPTRMCGELFELEKFEKSRGNPFRCTHSKRRKDCPLDKTEVEGEEMKTDGMIRGGDGSHWGGCEETHWDCKIAMLDKENLELKIQLGEWKTKVEDAAQEIEILKEALDTRQTVYDQLLRDYMELIHAKTP
jgi:hypothetical protein